MSPGKTCATHGKTVSKCNWMNDSSSTLIQFHVERGETKMFVFVTPLALPVISHGLTMLTSKNRTLFLLYVGDRSSFCFMKRVRPRLFARALMPPV